MALKFFGREARRKFEYFLCHHKGGAGAFARLLKLEFRDELPPDKKVWIDCDDLQNLEMLFDYVGSQSETVVVLLSKELLHRPWCMGELVTAHRQQPRVRMVPIVFPDFEKPSDEFIDNYASIVDITCLGPHGISVENIRAMQLWLRDLESISISASIKQDQMYALMHSIAEYKALSRKSQDKAMNRRRTPPATVYTKVSVVADHLNMESLATGLVLSKYVATHMLHSVSMLPCFISSDTPLPETTENFVCVLSNGCFVNADFVAALVKAAEMTICYIPIIAEDGFRFPSATMKKELEVTMPSMMKAVGLKVATSSVIQVIHDIFKEIAVVFAPQDYSSTDTLLKLKAKDVANRITGEKLQKLHLVDGANGHANGVKAEPEREHEPDTSSADKLRSACHEDTWNPDIEREFHM